MQNSQPLSQKKKSKNISSFLKKTCDILDDTSNNHIVEWAHNGIGFIVISEDLFSKQVLPKYFKHSNYSSFVRQLNMYNFHKIRQGVAESFFFHEFFDQHDRKKIAEIKRKPEKKKRKNQESQEEEDEVSIHLGKKAKACSRISKKQKKFQEDSLKSNQINIEKKQQQYTVHILNSENDAEQKQGRQSEKNIFSIEIDDDKISINDDMIQRYPHIQTKDLICASNNMIPFSFPAQLLNFSLLL